MKTNNVKQTILLMLFNVLLTIIAVVVSTVAFIKPAIKNEAEASDVLSIYDETKYDFIINNPSEEQIINFTQSEYVKKVVPFYQLVYTFNIKNEEIELTMKSIESDDDLSYTEFAQERIVCSKNIEGNKIYLDYSFSKQYGVNLGDKIGSGNMSFTVAGFYKNYNVSLAYVPELKNIVSSTISYSGVYVEISNEESFRTTFLNDYKPLATLKSRDAFSDDTAYNNYLIDFNNRDYSSYIKEKSLGYEEAKESYNNKMSEAKNSYLIGGIITGVVLLVGIAFITIINQKKNKTEVVNGGRKQVLTRYLLSGLVALVSFVISWIVGCNICIGQQTHFISLSNIFVFGWTSVVLPMIAVVLGYVLNNVLVQGYKEKKSQQQKNTEEQALAQSNKEKKK